MDWTVRTFNVSLNDIASPSGWCVIELSEQTSGVISSDLLLNELTIQREQPERFREFIL